MANGFDDQKLIKLARFSYFSTKKSDPNKDLEKMFEKEVLTNGERNYLLTFLEENKQVKPLSIRDMKTEIFSHIKFESPNQWGTTVNRVELEAIYKFILGAKK